MHISPRTMHSLQHASCQVPLIVFFGLFLVACITGWNAPQVPRADHAMPAMTTLGDARRGSDKAQERCSEATGPRSTPITNSWLHRPQHAFGEQRVQDAFQDTVLARGGRLRGFGCYIVREAFPGSHPQTQRLPRHRLGARRTTPRLRLLHRPRGLSRFSSTV